MITNKYNLPKAFEEFAKRDGYSANPKHYSATTLLKGIKEIVLSKRHYGEVDQDVADMIWMLFGTAVHSILERQAVGENEIKEERLTKELGDYTLSGQFDLYNKETKTITDYKTASVWKIIYGDYSDWRKQLLIYAYLLREEGYQVEKAEIVALLKDHSKRDAKLKAEYPKLPVEVVKFKFDDKDFEDIEKFIISKLAEIKKYENTPDDEIPECTPEERWNTGDKFAVMKNGRKTALRVLDSEADAKSYMATNGGDYIEKRPGEDKKCSEYCNYCQYCNYYKKTYGGTNGI